MQSAIVGSATTRKKHIKADVASQLREICVALTLVEERERRAIATTLHDDLGQMLAVLKMRLDLLNKEAPPGPLADGLAGVAELLTQASERARSLASQLSPAILYDLGLVPALEWLADEMHRLHSLTVQVDAQVPARAPLDPSVRTVMFRAVRELLVNVARHAHTDAAHVGCSVWDGELVIVVEDAGQGFDAAAMLAPGAHRGFGLLSIRERLLALGGTMICDSVPGGGSRVTLKAPAVASTAV